MWPSIYSLSQVWKELWICGSLVYNLRTFIFRKKASMLLQRLTPLKLFSRRSRPCLIVKWSNKQRCQSIKAEYIALLGSVGVHKKYTHQIIWGQPHHSMPDMYKSKEIIKESFEYWIFSFMYQQSTYTEWILITCVVKLWCETENLLKWCLKNTVVSYVLHKMYQIFLYFIGPFA